MKKCLFFSVVFVILSFSIFCDTNDEAKLIFYRPKKMFGMAINKEIIINQSVFVQLGNNQYFSISLKPAEYLIYLRDKQFVPGEEWSAKLLGVEPNETYFFKITPGTKIQLDPMNTKPDLSEYSEQTEYTKLRK